MSAGMMRRLARALARKAARATPAEHADWGRAMAREVDHIGDDGAALRWALGCLWAGYRLRSMSMSPGFLVTVRCVLAAVMSLYALTQASVGLMVLGFKTGNPGMVAASEGAVAGDSAAPYAALMEQMPMTLVWAALLAVLLYLAGSVALAFGWRRAPLLLLVAFALELAGKVATRFLPAWSQTFGARDAAIDLVTLGALAGLGILAFWLAAQRPHTPV